jgi:RNA polymerase sigma factor (TIGR02999 family)
LRLVGDGGPQWHSRPHFFAAAAEAMRRILVEQARRKGRVKHGGGWRRVDVADVDVAVEPAQVDDLIALDDALEALGRVDPTKAELVKLHYFAGLSLAEAAGMLGISPATADRYWAIARAWLYRAIQGTRAGAATGAGGGEAARAQGNPERG